MLINRAITPKIIETLKRGKSILLFGPRQSGKTTLVKHLEHDLYITLMNPDAVRSYGNNKSSLIAEAKALQNELNRKPIIIIDEVQKIPNITDSIQVLIDEGIAQFIITGSSARKIKNLLPGRVIKYDLSSLSLLEIETENLEDLLVNGSLPEVYLTENQRYKDELLKTYVDVYIEEEIRKEALVRNIGSFTDFVKMACIESGNTVNFSKISEDVGVAHHTISDYYTILEECLLVDRIPALTKSATRKRLTKAPKYIISDLGIKRIGADEPSKFSRQQMASTFEQFVGLELGRIMKQKGLNANLYFWRSHDGPEVDFVVQYNQLYIPIEVKWAETPTTKDIRHLLTFKQEYDVRGRCYVICRCKREQLLADDVFAIPWQEIEKVFPA